MDGVEGADGVGVGIAGLFWGGVCEVGEVMGAGEDGDSLVDEGEIERMGELEGGESEERGLETGGGEGVGIDFFLGIVAGVKVIGDFCDVGDADFPG